MLSARENDISGLTSVLQHKVPNARLQVQALPLVSEIKLALIESTYPQASLSAEQVEFLMDSPPYWAFCWASGQVMARYLLDNPNEVKNKSIIDFGCGSGIVAIAAKLAGAKHVTGVDIDQAALTATQFNASLNGVNLETSAHCAIDQVGSRPTVLLIADVFYDEANIPMLSQFLNDYDDVIVADSRVKPDALDGVSEVARYASSTVPDLGESIDFNSVGVYRRG